MLEDNKISRVIFEVLTDVCGTDEVVRNPQLQLFANGLLDSFGTVELILTIYEELGIDISPSELDREMWATPEKIINYIEAKDAEAKVK